MVNLKEYAAREPEWIEGEGIRLAATVYRRHPKRWIVGVHGGHSERKRNGPRWAHLNALAEQHGWSFVAFDLRDVDGDSQPHLDATITQSLQDLSLVLYNTALPDGEVILWGHSRGAFVSFAWAAIIQHPQVAACVLVAPAWSSYKRFLARIAQLGFSEESWRLQGEVSYLRSGKVETRTWDDMEDARNWDRRERELASGFQTPTLVIHSRQDRVIPYTLSEDLGGLCPKAEVRIVPFGDHQFNGHEAQLMAETEKFLIARGTF